jgi:hypothetical protein
MRILLSRRLRSWLRWLLTRALLQLANRVGLLSPQGDLQ